MGQSKRKPSPQRNSLFSKQEARAPYTRQAPKKNFECLPIVTMQIAMMIGFIILAQDFVKLRTAVKNAQLTTGTEVSAVSQKPTISNVSESQRDSIYYTAYDQGFNDAIQIKYDSYDKEIELLTNELRSCQGLLEFASPQKIANK